MVARSEKVQQRPFVLIKAEETKLILSVWTSNLVDRGTVKFAH